MPITRRGRPGRSAFAPAVGVKTPPNASTPSTSTPPSSQPTPTSRRNVQLKRAAVHFLSGGLSAGLVRFSLQPLDTLKTRLQASSSRGPLRATLLRNQGLPGLYRGAIPSIMGIVPAAAVYMLTFQTLKTRLARGRKGKARSGMVAISAALADVVACVVRVPCEVVKQRLQVGVYGNLSGAIREISQLGVGRLYAGLSAQLARDVPYAAVEFMFYERLKEGRGDMSKAEGFVVGGVSGAAAAIASNPLDVVKTRLMTQGGAGRYTGVGQALVRVAREEGVAAFGKGLAPRIAAKTLQSALFFGVYETLKRNIASVVGVDMKGAEAGGAV